MSIKGWEYVRCSEKKCPIWLPWDRHLGYVLSEVQSKMHPVLPQGFFYCFRRKPCKVGLTKRTESPNCGRCFLTCTQNAQCKGCLFSMDRQSVGSRQFRSPVEDVKRSIKCFEKNHLCHSLDARGGLSASATIIPTVWKR